jgi:heme exporter protein D
MKEFLAMGGYAAYVWPSYILTFAVVFANVVWARRAARRARAAAMRAIAAATERA